MQKIVTCLAFDNQAEAAVDFYVSIFKNSQIIRVERFGEVGPGPKGEVMSVMFELEGQTFMAINGGSHFTFSDGISLFVNCERQAEIDALWEKLSTGGEKGPCGWLKDKFGVSWQIVPTIFLEMLQDEDSQKSQRVMQAILQMGKIDIEVLRQVYNQ